MVRVAEVDYRFGYQYATSTQPHCVLGYRRLYETDRMNRRKPNRLTLRPRLTPLADATEALTS